MIYSYTHHLSIMHAYTHESMVIDKSHEEATQVTIGTAVHNTPIPSGCLLRFGLLSGYYSTRML